ncbi:hypothetical protein LTR08_006333 [Meristemomyces frigidus]|nr:hypothetical protein LTR08_006333 [Meristemomyces frigidus]
MSTTNPLPVPPTPRVISPSPTPSEPPNSARDGYFPQPPGAPQRSPVERREERASHEEDADLIRARPRNRPTPLKRKQPPNRQAPTTGLSPQKAKTALPPTPTDAPATARRRDAQNTPPGGPSDNSSSSNPNGLLSPASAYPQPPPASSGPGYGSAYWRALSRSPSPLGLIPIHASWRHFIHRHEIPRKTLHCSIGFLALTLYAHNHQPSDIHPTLLHLLLPISLVEIIRFRWPALNNLYITLLGPLMRESEAHDRVNSTIPYLAGLYLTLRLCRKDIALLTILLLSWCDPCASTFGRLYGHHTPRLRRNKSLAGSLAAFLVGAAAAALFYAVVAPRAHAAGVASEGGNGFAFRGRLTLPAPLRRGLGCSSAQQSTLTGAPALAVVSVVAGLAASASEAVDLWGLDDNLTIPVLCGLELGGFLWAFGG